MLARFLPATRSFMVVAIVLAIGLPLASLADEDCHPSQSVFNFSGVMVGSEAMGFMDLTNNTDEMLEINVQVDSPHFSHSGYHVFVPPGESRTINPLFHPQEAGYFEAIMSFGNDLCQEVLLTGTGLGRSCAVEPDYLDFGTVDLGEMVSRTVTVTNDGDVDVPIEAGTLSPVVAVLGPSGDLAPGESFAYEVRFSPNGPGAFTGVIDWGAWYPTCGGVHFSGEGTINMEPGENRVGVFFDTEYTELIHLNDGSAEFLTGYLVLTSPSAVGGVSAWECLPGTEGAAYIMNWDIEGDYINAGIGDQLIVGIGGDPLPHAEDILLASCEIYVAESAGELISVQLGPIWNPTIPGRMAWIPADENGEPLVMLPFTGVEAVAWIQTAAISPVDDPLPEVGTRIVTNVPNPFNPSTEIRFNVAKNGPVQIRIYDLTGRLVRTLLDEQMHAGPHARVWDGKDSAGRSAPSGAYYVRLETVGEMSSRKVMLLK